MLRAAETTADLAAWFGGDRRRSTETDPAAAEWLDDGVTALTQLGLIAVV